MTTLAFCGLGSMGAPMAARLLQPGNDLVVWNRTPARASGLVDRGARLARSPAEAASSAEVVFTMLATPEALEAVVLGDEGVAAGLEPDATLIDMSTVGPDCIRRLAERSPEGSDAIDAPVLGSVPQATDGTLAVFVGGTDEVVARRWALLERFGQPVHMGPLGAGAAMKLVANSTLGTLMTGLGEALALADGLGLDESQVLDALAGSAIGATVKSKRALVERGEYPANFALRLAAKDLRLVDEAARAAGLDPRLGAAARSWLEAAEAAGLGDLDYSAVIAQIRGRPASDAS